MTILMDRRALLAVGGFGVAGLLLPGGRLAAQALLGMTGFTHNVASGEPAADSMLLWTRFKPKSGGDAKLRAEVSDSKDFTRIVSGGEVVTGAWRDHTAKISVAGLAPDRWYWFRFIGPDGSVSPVGRTRTLPVGKVAKFNIGVFSCSNLGFGEFNAYGHAAARDDLDLWLHMGDYIYEYGRGGYDAGGALAEKIFPAHECVALADYRMRYAAYRLDPQLQALHARAPMIVSTDDHEMANDAWEGGAQNHQPDEGQWANRKAAAMQAWHEWLPVSEAPWAAYRIGDLATYFRTDTRGLARSRPHEWADVMRGPDREKALAAFRNGDWQDDAATMLGSAQEHWLTQAMAANKAAWTLLGVGTNTGHVFMPDEAVNWIAPDAPAIYHAGVKAGVAATKAGLPYNLDAWSGYPKARSRLFKAAQAAAADMIVVTGDSHNGWAFDLPEGGKPAGVEFGGHSVTSPGYEAVTMGKNPLDVAREVVAASPELKWMDASNRGYMHLSLTPAAATNTWVFMDSVAKLGLATKAGHSMTVRKGRRVLEVA